MKLKPFYQGKLDVFCAMYAVLNGLRLTHGIRTLKARDLLNETLLGLASNPAAFRAVLNQETDYIALVDAMLRVSAPQYPLQVVKPFGLENWPDVATFWQSSQAWLNPSGKPAENRAIVLRFARYDRLDDAPRVRHWTTIDTIDDNIIHLFDSSHEAESIQNMRRNIIATRSSDINEERRIYIQPDSVRFLRLPF